MEHVNEEVLIDSFSIEDLSLEERVEDLDTLFEYDSPPGTSLFNKISKRKANIIEEEIDAERDLLNTSKEILVNERDKALIILGVPAKMSETTVRTFIIKHIQKNYNVSPEIVQRFLRHEIYWKVVFSSKEDLEKLRGQEDTVMMRSTPITLSFVLPILSKDDVSGNAKERKNESTVSITLSKVSQSNSRGSKKKKMDNTKKKILVKEVKQVEAEAQDTHWCHNCKSKKICQTCEKDGCRSYYCLRCLQKYPSELVMGKRHCPRCRGICMCKKCRKIRGETLEKSSKSILKKRKVIDVDPHLSNNVPPKKAKIAEEHKHEPICLEEPQPEPMIIDVPKCDPIRVEESKPIPDFEYDVVEEKNNWNSTSVILNPPPFDEMIFFHPSGEYSDEVLEILYNIQEIVDVKKFSSDHGENIIIFLVKAINRPLRHHTSTKHVWIQSEVLYKSCPDRVLKFYEHTMSIEDISRTSVEYVYSSLQRDIDKILARYKRIFR